MSLRESMSSTIAAQRIGQASQLYLSIDSRDGPLVTPELHTVAADRVWMMTARSTAKGRLLGDGDRVGLCVRGSDGCVVAGGRVAVFDALEPATVIRKLGLGVAAGRGLVSFLVDNGHEMAGALHSALKGQLGFPPDPRLLLSVELDWSLVTDPDGVVVEVILPDGSSPPSSNHAMPTPEALRRDADVPVLDDGPAVLGWSSSWGPLALPGTWSASAAALEVHGSVFEALGAPLESAASLCVDHCSGPGPMGKQGSVFRGRGTATVEGGRWQVAIDVARIVEWSGITTEARQVSDAG